MNPVPDFNYGDEVWLVFYPEAGPWRFSKFIISEVWTLSSIDSTGVSYILKDYAFRVNEDELFEKEKAALQECAIRNGKGE